MLLLRRCVLYSDLLARLKPFGITQVGKLLTDGDTIVILAHQSEVVFPFAFIGHTLYLETDSLDCWIHTEVVKAVCRRFGIEFSRVASQPN